MKAAHISSKELCILSGCYSEQFARGLCRHHYDAARYAIRVGLDSWKGLEEAGRALPSIRDHHDQHELRAVICALVRDNVYPSLNNLRYKMGRRLTNAEVRFRNEIFTELGIDMKYRGADPPAPIPR